MARPTCHAGNSADLVRLSRATCFGVTLQRVVPCGMARLLKESCHPAWRDSSGSRAVWRGATQLNKQSSLLPPTFLPPAFPPNFSMAPPLPPLNPLYPPPPWHEHWHHKLFNMKKNYVLCLVWGEKNFAKTFCTFDHQFRILNKV